MSESWSVRGDIEVNDVILNDMWQLKFYVQKQLKFSVSLNLNYRTVELMVARRKESPRVYYQAEC